MRLLFTRDSENRLHRGPVFTPRALPVQQLGIESTAITFVLGTILDQFTCQVLDRAKVLMGLTH